MPRGTRLTEYVCYDNNNDDKDNNNSDYDDNEADFDPPDQDWKLSSNA